MLSFLQLFTYIKEKQIFLINKDIQMQSHKWLTASSSLVKYLRISSYTRKPFLIYDFATDPIWIFLYEENFFFFFISVPLAANTGSMLDAIIYLTQREKKY